MKKEPKWLYRLDAGDAETGLWYNSRGEWVFNIGELKNCESKSLPMGYDERYRKDGCNWFASCTRQEDLTHWFSRENAEELIRNKGFKCMKYLATEYEEYELETCFIKESCIDKQEISLEDLFGGAE